MDIEIHVEPDVAIATVVLILVVIAIWGLTWLVCWAGEE